MPSIEVIMLFQSVVMLITGGVVACYTFETMRLRQSAAIQAEVMWRTHKVQLEEMQRAAEPIFVWGPGLASAGGDVKWTFRNEGGPIDHITVRMQSRTGAQTGVKATIRPEEWLGNSRDDMVSFRGEISEQFRFTIGCRTRLGGVGGFFLSRRSQRSRSTQAAAG